MFKKAILSIIVVAGVATASMTSNIQQAFAQEGPQAPPKEFTGEIPTMFTRQPCDSVGKMLDTVKKYGEEMLFIGNGMTFSAQTGMPFIGGMMFTVNQDSGTWSMLQLFGDGMACMVMNGRDFKPYMGPMLQTMDTYTP